MAIFYTEHSIHAIKVNFDHDRLQENRNLRFGPYHISHYIHAEPDVFDAATFQPC
jgi:hypothetical protein